MLGQKYFEGKMEICGTHTEWLNFINMLPTNPSSRVKEENELMTNREGNKFTVFSMGKETKIHKNE